MDTKIEYRVRPVTRYVVTRHEESTDGRSANSGSTVGKGEYDNPNIAYEVAYALCKGEHERLGYPPDDMRIIYPKPPADMDMSSPRIAGARFGGP